MLVAGFELSIYSLLLLGVLFIAYQTDKFLMDEKVKQLKKIMMVVAGLIIMDIVLVSLDGQHHYFANISLLVGNTLYYILSPLLSYFWLHYVLLFLYKDQQKIKRLLWLGGIILSVNVIISFINLQYPIYFSVDINNMYQRENGMIINSVFSYIMIVIASFFILKNSKKIRYQDLIALLFFMVPPTIANVVQAINEGTLVVWPGIVFSLLVAFIYIQNKTMAKDYLSGLYNKMEFDQYLEYIITRKPSRGFVVLLIDINDFKFINYNYGHDAGDKVIHQIGVLLKESFRANDLIARIGGD